LHFDLERTALIGSSGVHLDNIDFVTRDSRGNLPQQTGLIPTSQREAKTRRFSIRGS